MFEMFEIDLNRLQKEKKLLTLVEKVYGRKNGNRLRHVVRVVAKAYKQKPEQLREFFGHMNDKLAGIATSAYHLLTRDIKQIQKIMTQDTSVEQLKKDLERRLEEKIRKYNSGDLVANHRWEEFAYVDIQSCECGGKYEPAKQVLDVRDKVAHDLIYAKCEKCGKDKIFEFGILTYYHPKLLEETVEGAVLGKNGCVLSLPAEQNEETKLKISACLEFLKDLQKRPSRIIDVYQWICLAETHTKETEFSTESGREHAFGRSKTAVNCVKEALKFYPPDQAYPPVESFFNTQVNEQIMAKTNKENVLAFKSNIEEVIKLLEKYFEDPAGR